MRILIAEDEPIIALGLAERLRRMGHEPLGPASDGHEAVRAAIADPPDVYLFDVDMPRLDGLSAAEALAARGLRRPVVVLTGVDDPQAVDRSVSGGVAAYLTKPIDDRQLDAAIRLAAARHAELEAVEQRLHRVERSLADRKVIERAKGLLMEALELSEGEAYARLQRAARNRNVSVAAIARDVVEHGDLLKPGGTRRP